MSLKKGERIISINCNCASRITSTLEKQLESKDVRVGIMPAHLDNKIQETYAVSAVFKEGRKYVDIQIPAHYCPFCGSKIKNGAPSDAPSYYSPKNYKA